MKKLFLASILAFSVLCATEENVWEIRGAYVKYGLSSPVVIPICPTLGYGYYWSQGVDISAMGYFGYPDIGLDVKVLALPKIKEKLHFGVGPAYSLFYGDGTVGLGLLFRFPNPNKKTFFQIELTQPIIRIQHGKSDDVGLEYLPHLGLMWGYKF
ncbi:MAG: hypothetical protein ChlgKO_03390 [Chlamydiales bacterium]